MSKHPVPSLLCSLFVSYYPLLFNTATRTCLLFLFIILFFYINDYGCILSTKIALTKLEQESGEARTAWNKTRSEFCSKDVSLKP